MKQKIAVIGGGLFGITAYIKLKRKGFDCSLFEKKKDLLCGASTNNLNRVHFGYHYPRDDETAKQSYKGYNFDHPVSNSGVKGIVELDEKELIDWESLFLLSEEELLEQIQKNT